MSLYKNLVAEFEKSQLGYATVAIIAQSCIGAVAAMMLLMNDMGAGIKISLLFLVTILCMGFNGAVLVHMKARPTFNILVASLLFSILVIIANLI